MLNENEFVLSHKGTWESLRFQTLRFEGNPTDISPEEISNFFALYDQVSRDLSIARSETGNEELIDSLNSILVRANRVKYRIPTKRQKVSLDYVLYQVARTVRSNAVFIWFAFALFLFASFAGFATLQFRPELRSTIVTAGMERNFAGWKSGKHREKTDAESMMMWSFYSSNNSMVSLRVAAMGASTFGIGTTIGLWQNGLLIGALAQETNTTGALDHLLSSIYPHGASEIFGIFIAGGAGYAIAWGVICPGRRKRSEALIQSSKNGFVLFSLSAIMMFIAAPFEAWFSFNPEVPTSLKLIVGTIVLISWLVFFGLYGKDRDTFYKQENIG